MELQYSYANAIDCASYCGATINPVDLRSGSFRNHALEEHLTGGRAQVIGEGNLEQ